MSFTRQTYSEVGQITYETLDDIFRQAARLDLSQDTSFSFSPVLFAMTSPISPRYLFEILRNTHSDRKLEAADRPYSIFIQTSFIRTCEITTSSAKEENGKNRMHHGNCPSPKYTH